MMSQPLAELVAELRSLTAEIGVSELGTELPDTNDRGPVRIGFAGPYNAGKSSLIAALTGDLSIKRDAKPETVVASRYPWRDSVLIDLPGWFSGFDDHDEVAEDELRRMVDLVVFTMTVELGEEHLASAAQRVFVDLAFADRGLVVVNKSNSEDNEPGVILDEVTSRFGDALSVPVVLTDAQDYLDTIEDDDYLAHEIETLQADSGIPELADRIDELAQRWRIGGRLASQIAQAKRVAEELLIQIQPDDEEQAAAETITALDAAVAASRSQLERALESRMDELESALQLIADEELRVDDFSYAAQQAAWQRAVRGPNDHLADDADRIVEMLTNDFGDLAVELERFHADAAGPNARAADTTDDGASWARRFWKGTGIGADKLADMGSRQLRKVADAGSGKDSTAYDLAKRLQPWKKFKPYERLEHAGRIRGAARVGEHAVAPVTAGFSELMAWRADKKKRDDRRSWEKETRARYADAAAKERRTVSASFTDFMAVTLAPFDAEVERLRASQDELDAVRGERVARLQSVLVSLQDAT